MEEVEVEYPVGHRRRVSFWTRLALSFQFSSLAKVDLTRPMSPVVFISQREEGIPLLLAKFKRHIGPHFSQARQDK